MNGVIDIYQDDGRTWGKEKTTCLVVAGSSVRVCHHKFGTSVEKQAFKKFLIDFFRDREREGGRERERERHQFVVPLIHAFIC